MEQDMHQKHHERATAFPILISLATLCMLQPRGRVLGSSHRERIFIRTFPLLCVLDSLDLLLRWLLTSLYLRCPLFMALKIVGHDRFQYSEPLVGIEKIRANPLIRLLYFFLIALPALWTLSSFVFTPTAKIDAGMYVGSFIVDEFVSAFAPPEDFFKLPRRKFRSLANYASCLTHQDEERVTRFRETLLSLDILEIIATGLIVVGQCVAFVWLCFAYDCFWDMEGGSVVRLCARKVPLIILAAVVALLFSPVTNSFLLKFPALGRALNLVYPKAGSPAEFETDRRAKVWFVFIFGNFLMVGVEYRAFLMKVAH